MVYISYTQDPEGMQEYLAKITLTNQGQKTIKSNQDWIIYFYSFREIEKKHMTKDGILVGNDKFVVRHVNGQLYSITSTGIFEGLKPGATASITYRVYTWNAARTDNLPNWYYGIIFFIKNIF